MQWHYPISFHSCAGDGEDLADHTKDLLSKRVQELNVLSRDGKGLVFSSNSWYMLNTKI